MEKLYTVSKNKTGSWLWLRWWTPYCQIQTYIEEVGKTTRPFRYDLNQIPYDYTVDVRNRFNRLELIECLMNYGQNFMTLYKRQVSWPNCQHLLNHQKSKRVPEKHLFLDVSIFFIDHAKVFDSGDHNKLWKILKEFSEFFFQKTIWCASWETCMQVRKQQLELDMEQQTGSK